MNEGTEAPHRRVLIVEDDEIASGLVAEALTEAGYATDEVGSGEDALKSLTTQFYDVVLLDLHLPRMQGLSVLAAAGSLQTDAQFIVMTAFGSVDTAVEAMKLGACDYLMKPFRVEELVFTVERACAETELRREVARLRGMQPLAAAGERLLGRSPPMRRLRELIERVAPLRATVLITGETGSGKELVARAIHDRSPRARRPFVAVNCSALPEGLLESELFGHVKGSFTGAVASRRGLFEEAAGGTLFLDEISTISPQIQVKLLRVLEERTIHRVGSTQPIALDFRLIAATNEQLAQRTADGTFREDLYYRLNVFPIRVPPLRERRDDVPLLAHHFRMDYARDNGIEAPDFSAVTLRRMIAYEWPGNVRELENFVERSVILHAGANEIRSDPAAECDGPGHAMVERAAQANWDLGRLEREYILATLERTEGHRGRAAELLGIDRRTLYRKLSEIDSRSETGQH